MRAWPAVVAVCLASGCGSEAAPSGEVDAGADSVVADSAIADTGAAPVDTGVASDTGPGDIAIDGGADGGATDTGAADTTAAETLADTGSPDTTIDSGATDTSAPDTGPADTGPADTGSVDTGTADTTTDSGGATDSATDAVSDAPKPCVPGVISWWRAEDDAMDAIGTNHGTVTGAMTYATAKVGKGFNGTGGHVAVPDSSSLQLTSAITIELWVKTTQTTNGRLVDKLGSASDGYMLDVGGSSGGATGKPRFFIGSSSLIPGAGFTVNDGALRHVAATYDGATMRLYIDGKQVATAARAGTIPTGTTALRLSNNATSTLPFTGLMDEVAIFGRALSATEIADIHAGNTKKCK